jgi:hypothetical protein
MRQEEDKINKLNQINSLTTKLNNFKNMQKIKQNLRKVVTIVICLAVSGATLFAQDVITLRNGSDVQAIVQEVSANDVRYKRADNPDGPTYTMRKSEIFMITYANGSREVFNEAAATPATTQQQAETSSPEPVVASAISQRTNAFSQPAVETDIPLSAVRFGIKGGLNVSYETTSKSSSDTRAGIHAGILVEVPVARNISVQPELVYSQQGCSFQSNNKTYTEKWDYINIPLMFRFYVLDRRLGIEGGPQIGVLVNGTISDGRTSVNLRDVYDVNDIDVAICFGVSYSITDNFEIGLRSNVGVLKVTKNNENTGNTMQFGLAYRF